ncbi:putative peptidase [Sphingomonas paucimobilis]|uniref:Atxe2 family lasso peptide isopeptidase n=1 Tax=Sphingobium sp. IP1 TaxID=2021637 RepID=UPI000451967B|nr:Atxe2 family lasso peptide isopeptidase [Sphingobium sp. IP1]EZP70607.1 putative peptidase [Sphingomonas paucimobilis]
MTGLLLAIAASAISAPAQPACTDVPQGGVSTTGTRLMTSDDLARLRDFGEPTDSQSDVGLSVSPDGRQVAFQIRQADPVSNSYCLSMIVMATDGHGEARIVDRGGELILRHDPQWGLGPYPSGNAKAIKAEWSPDGRSLAFLKQVNGQVQAWVADPSGGGSRAVATGPSNVVGVKWADNAPVLDVTFEDLTALKLADAQEARQGYHLDDRFVPVTGDRPFFVAPLPQRHEAIPVSPFPTASFTKPEDVGRAPTPPPHWLPFVIVDQGAAVSIEELARKAGITRSCPDAACSGRILAAWQAADRQSLLFLRRVGRANGDMALYLWRIDKGKVIERFRTAGLLLGCEPAQDMLVCAQEEATVPRRIIRLNPQTGAPSLVFDPNPEFKQFRLGPVRRLFWSNDRGIETYGDLVLPSESRKGEKLPLIVTTYRSRGFLRGGTGDEYPIQPLAARGYAVLSFDEPRHVASFVKTSSQAEYNAINRKNWANRRSIQSSLEAGIAMVERLGLTDPTRRAITGLSEGASILWFSLINSNLFAAASVSHCCEEPISSMALLGERGAKGFEAGGYPLLSTNDQPFWANMSVSRNAAKISTPILFNLADAEYLHSLVSIRALRFFGQPVDAYVFPDEQHIKWQAAHRLAVYERNIAWFDFWLKGIPPRDAETAKRWTLLRDRKPVAEKKAG